MFSGRSHCVTVRDLQNANPVADLTCDHGDFATRVFLQAHHACKNTLWLIGALILMWQSLLQVWRKIYSVECIFTQELPIIQE